MKATKKEIAIPFSFQRHLLSVLLLFIISVGYTQNLELNPTPQISNLKNAIAIPEKFKIQQKNKGKK